MSTWLQGLSGNLLSPMPGSPSPRIARPCNDNEDNDNYDDFRPRAYFVRVETETSIRSLWALPLPLLLTIRFFSELSQF